MTTVTGKVVKIQLTIEYTRDGEEKPFHTKVVTIPRDDAEKIGAMIFSVDTHDEIVKGVHGDKITDGLNSVQSLSKNSSVGLNGGEESSNTLSIVYKKDEGVEEQVLAACGPVLHPPTWDLQ